MGLAPRLPSLSKLTRSESITIGTFCATYYLWNAENYKVCDNDLRSKGGGFLSSSSLLLFVCRYRALKMPIACRATEMTEHIAVIDSNDGMVVPTLVCPARNSTPSNLTEY